MAGATVIDPRAVVDPDARVGDGCTIGPFCVIGAGVTIGDGCRLESHVSVQGPTVMGEQNVVALGHNNLQIPAYDARVDKPFVRPASLKRDARQTALA